MNEMNQNNFIIGTIPGSKIKKIFKIMGIILVVPFCIIAVVLFYLIKDLYNFNNEVFNESKFNKEIWLQAEREYNPAPKKYFDDISCIRGKMYHNLKNNYLKKEMTWNEIEELLGQTSARRIYEEGNYKKECLQYHLGYCAKLGGPPTLLVFCPAKNGKWTYMLTNYNDSGYFDYKN